MKELQMAEKLLSIGPTLIRTMVFMVLWWVLFRGFIDWYWHSVHDVGATYLSLFGIIQFPLVAILYFLVDRRISKKATGLARLRLWLPVLSLPAAGILFHPLSWAIGLVVYGGLWAMCSMSGFAPVGGCN